MKIALITPGSGPDFYCKNCIRDANLIQALRRFNNDLVFYRKEMDLYLKLMIAVF